MVGAYITLSFILIELLTNIGVLNFLTNIICCVLRIKNSHDIVLSILKGCLEITSGIANLSLTNANLFLKTIISSSLIGFGGISIILQNINFINKLQISVKTIFLQKFTQCVICLITTTILCFIFL